MSLISIHYYPRSVGDRYSPVETARSNRMIETIVGARESLRRNIAAHSMSRATSRKAAWRAVYPAMMSLLLNANFVISAPGDMDWPGYGDDTKEQRFSPLAQINDQNVGRLGLVWSLDLPDENALEGTPLEVGGVLYFSGSFATIYAVDVRTGRLLWKFDPKANEAGPRETRRVWGNNRGVAYWDGKVYVATKDCRMIAVDAHTGEVVWSSSFLVPGSNSTSSGAPRIFKGKVIIGNSGAEFAARGYVTAFDAKTGKLAWRFFIVPGDPAKGPDGAASDSIMPKAAKTWGGEWWKYGGGGTPWNAITYDQELNQLYIGTGNGGPWNGGFRAPHGEDNLFLASVIALDPDTGKYKWHYQYNPDEVWDYKATADIILADLTIDERRRKVLMQAPTNGFFYVIDRYTGKLISAEKIGKVTWADHIDLKTGRPVELPNIRGEHGSSIIYPDTFGAHNWQAMSYSPMTGMVYIPYMQLGMKYGPAPSTPEAVDVTTDPRKIILRMGVAAESIRDEADPMDERGSLLAWDPVAQKARWRVDYPFFLNAGTMTTAGNLVFQGTNTGQFHAYSADKGKRLWSFDAKLGILSPPISYSSQGRQYVSLLVGYGGPGGEGRQGRKQGWKYGLQPRRLLTFALDGKAKLPQTAPPDFSVNALDDARIILDPVKVARGAALYNTMTCTICHGNALNAGGGGPDLRESAIALNRAAFRSLLRSGSLISKGMPLFDDLTDDELESLYQYIRSGARDAKTGHQSVPSQVAGP